PPEISAAKSRAKEIGSPLFQEGVCGSSGLWEFWFEGVLFILSLNHPKYPQLRAEPKKSEAPSSKRGFGGVLFILSLNHPKYPQLRAEPKKSEAPSSKRGFVGVLVCGSSGLWEFKHLSYPLSTLNIRS